MKEMIRIYDLNLDLPDLEKKVVALGYFDGVHLGHQKLMKRNIELSKKYNFTPSVLLFKENTKNKVKDNDAYLSSLEDKIEILSDMGIKTFCLINFDKSFMELSPREFVEKIIVEKLNAKIIVVGSDYRFGYKASGDIKLLKEYEKVYSFTTDVVDFEMEDEKDKISSKHLRSLVKEGEISQVNKFLGRYYRIKGKVVDGKKRGRTLNFPTANLDLSYPYVIPRDGVYLTRVRIEDEYFYSLTNIGSNPTFETSQDKKIETYIYDFNRNIYGEHIAVDFIEFFRPDYKFSSAKELIEQMDKDKKRGLDYIKNIEK